MTEKVSGIASRIEDSDYYSDIVSDIVSVLVLKKRLWRMEANRATNSESDPQNHDPFSVLSLKAGRKRAIVHYFACCH